MITDTLSNASLYRPVSKLLAAGLDYLRHTDLLSLPNGKHEIQGSQLFALVQEYQPKPMDQIIWEAHRKYIDIQYVVRGTEKMGFANIARLNVTTPYDEKNDAMLGSVQGDFVTLDAGSFVIFYPQDAHAPGLAPTVLQPNATQQAVKKIVMKVAVSDF